MAYASNIKALLKESQIALLVIDKQIAYADRQFRMSPGTSPKTFSEDLERTVGQLDSFIAWCRSKNMPIAWTRMTEDPAISPPVVAQRMTINNDVAISGPGQSAYAYCGAKPVAGELQVDKLLPDAFSVPELAEWLRSNKVQTVLLVGGFASRCVFSSTVGAQNNGFHAIVLKDLLITPIEFAHEVSVTNGIIHDILGYISTEAEVRASLA